MAACRIASAAIPASRRAPTPARAATADGAWYPGRMRGVEDRRRLTVASGQYEQHRPFGLRAVAGAASATSAAASSPARKRAPASTLGSPSARDAKCRPCGRRSRDARWNKSDSRTPSASLSSVCLASLPRSRRWASLRPIAHRWPVLRNRGGRPAVRGSRPPRAMIARGRAGAPRRMRAIAQARRASGQARP